MRFPAKERVRGWDANGVYAAEPDPTDPHATYVGGEGRLGYLRPASTGVQIDLPLERATRRHGALRLCDRDMARSRAGPGSSSAGVCRVAARRA